MSEQEKYPEHPLFQIYVDLAEEELPKKELNEFQKRQWLKSFQEAATPERIESIADDLDVTKEYNSLLPEFLRLAGGFAQTPLKEDLEMQNRLYVAITCRNPEFFKLVGKMMYDFNTKYTPEYQQSLDTLKLGRPTLKLVK